MTSGKNTCPSCRSPASATNKSPGCAARESVVMRLIEAPRDPATSFPAQAPKINATSRVSTVHFQKILLCARRRPIVAIRLSNDIRTRRAVIDVRLDVQVIRGALGDFFENWSGHLAAVVAFLRVIKDNRNAKLRV